VAQTLYDKIWQAHTVASINEQTDLLYIDRHLVHEVTSPQAFAGLREKTVRYVAQKKPLQQWIITYRLKADHLMPQAKYLKTS